MDDLSAMTNEELAKEGVEVLDAWRKLQKRLNEIWDEMRRRYSAECFLEDWETVL